MKVRVFTNYTARDAEAFNDWARGKTLSKDVIIRTNLAQVDSGSETKFVLIISIFFDDVQHPTW